MEKKTLLAEIETEQKKAIQKRFSQKQEKVEEKSEEPIKHINIFSASAFPKVDKEVETKEEEKPVEEKKISIVNNVQIEQSTSKEDTSLSKETSVVEKPNYDFMDTLSDEQRDKIFKSEQAEDKTVSNKKPKRNRFKMIVLAALFAVFGVWGIVNITTIDSVGTQITQETTAYNMNIAKYILKLKSLDGTSASNMSNLFDTIPVTPQKPNTIEKQSNWFDRFCNFIAGLFGG